MGEALVGHSYPDVWAPDVSGTSLPKTLCLGCFSVPEFTKTGSAPTPWETETQTMVLDHGLRPWFEPLLKGFPYKKESLD